MLDMVLVPFASYAAIAAIIVLIVWFVKYRKIRAEKIEEERLAAALQAEKMMKSAEIERAEQRKKATVRRFMESPRTIELAERFAESYISDLKRTSRKGYEQMTVDHSADITYYQSDLATIWLGYEKFDFRKNNISVMKSEEEMNALTNAIALLAKDYIEKNYPLDSSGTVYTLRITEVRDVVSNGYRLSYSAPNGFYKASTEW